MESASRQRQSGSTLIELLAVIAIVGIGFGAASMFFRTMEGPLKAGVALTEGQLRQARVSAMASTSAYRVRPTSNATIIAEKAVNCAATTWTADADLAVDLPRDVTFTDTSWSFCFGARGVSTVNASITLQHARLGTLQIEVLRGGTTRVLR